MKFSPAMLITGCYALEFIPTKEWQAVPEDVAVPDGLEIKMDLENGGRWARLPAGVASISDSTGLVDDRDNSLALVVLGEEDLEKLEDKAYDHDFGMDIMRDYGPSLVSMYTSKKELSDHAGRVLGICLRNNRDAARAFVSLGDIVVPYLKLEKRPLMILSALVTTPEGLQLAHSYGVPTSIRDQLEGLTKVDDSVARGVVSLVQNLAVSGEDQHDVCEWARVAHQLGNPVLANMVSAIQYNRGDFADIDIRCSVFKMQ